MQALLLQRAQEIENWRKLGESVRIEDERLQALALELGLSRPTDRQGYEGRHTQFSVIADLQALLTARAQEIEQVKALLREHLRQGDFGDTNVNYCWFCGHDVNRRDGTAAPHAENCLRVRSDAALVSRAPQERQYCTCLSISRDPLCVYHGDIDKVARAPQQEQD